MMANRGQPRGRESASRALRYSRRRQHAEVPVKMSRRIAIVEDEPAIRANYADALRRHGYDVAAYASRPEAMAAFRTRLPDLAVIDVGLGDQPDGGFTLCRDLRAMSETLPIVFLSARDSDFDIVAGLRIGADDYLAKDASLHQLTARIAALFRRVDLLAAPPSSEDVVRRGELDLMPDVAYNPASGEYLVAWQGDDDTAPLVDNEQEIFVQRLSTTLAKIGGVVERLQRVPVREPLRVRLPDRRSVPPVVVPEDRQRPGHERPVGVAVDHEVDVPAGRLEHAGQPLDAP